MGCFHECCCGNGQDFDQQGKPLPAAFSSVPPQLSADSGKRKKWRYKLKSKQSGRKIPAEVYYVKGSRIPVESLTFKSSQDSRFYYPPQQRCTSGRSGNPSLLFLLNWQIIPPLSRLAVIQRAVHCRNRSLLPVIREVGQEGGGDRRQRETTRITTPRQSRAVGMAEGDEEEEREDSGIQHIRSSPRSSPLIGSRRGQSTTSVMISVNNRSMSPPPRAKSYCSVK